MLASRGPWGEPRASEVLRGPPPSPSAQTGLRQAEQSLPCLCVGFFITRMTGIASLSSVPLGKTILITTTAAQLPLGMCSCQCPEGQNTQDSGFLSLWDWLSQDQTSTYFSEELRVLKADIFSGHRCFLNL